MNPAVPAFPHGQLTLTAAAPELSVGDPLACARAALLAIEAAAGSQIVLLPELTLGGYSCGDLFTTDAFTQAVQRGVELICQATLGSGQLVVFGAPLRAQDRWLNAAIAVADGQIQGIVPKQYLPNYREFYELRHFQPGTSDLPATVDWCGWQSLPLGIDLLFRWGDAAIGIEICEDLWVPIPPSSGLALAGANVLLNLSASNETVGKAAWRRSLVQSQSGRCLAAYAYASAGPSESTTDLVFGGHCLIAENGLLLAENQPLAAWPPQLAGPAAVTATIDLQRLQHDRGQINTFSQGRAELARQYRQLSLPLPVPTADPSAAGGPSSGGPSSGGLASGGLAASRAAVQPITGHPFVPADAADLAARCREILAIQVAGLAKRIGCLPAQTPLVIGVSGGLDSTLALLVAAAAVATTDTNHGEPPTQRIQAITMPGFGTTERTLTNAQRLMECLQVTADSIDIRSLALDTFRAIGHRPLGLTLVDGQSADDLQPHLVAAAAAGQRDLVFENVQARLRTYLLMSRGFVLGTGDLSEAALGWSTYNGDHMSMYNVNASVPKTLVRFLVRHLAAEAAQSGQRALAEVLTAIADTPISPELMPPDSHGQIRQHSEQTLGAYELHDFFLYHFVRFGASREKIRFLASHARFQVDYTAEQIERTLDVFFKRFFANQFKRSCVPDGPKVGSVSLSPRGDWRMPSDAAGGAF